MGRFSVIQVRLLKLSPIAMAQISDGKEIECEFRSMKEQNHNSPLTLI